ncbi:MAG: hypothetical protein RLZZ618_2166, partial [Pseudomonadota bacterium]
MAHAAHPGLRALLAPATRRDGKVAFQVLEQSGIECVVVPSLFDMAAELRKDVGTLILTDAALADPHFDTVLAALSEQEPWSDIPIVVMAQGNDDLASTALRRLQNVTVLERPTSVRTLIAAVQAALRARERQFQIRDQIEALRQADEALRAADRRKDEFLATLAHELRNPLAPIRSALHIMERGVEDSQTRTRLLAMMNRQMNVMVRLIDDLLDVARISSGKVTLEHECFDLRKAVDAAVEGARPIVDAASHQLVIEQPDRPVCVMGDATRLAQVIGNLLNNAAKYTPNGGRIELRLQVLDGVAVTTVKDNGVGIPRNMLDQVFRMFAQVNRTLDRAQGGLGIGLSLVHRLMEMHGGAVTAASGGVDLGSLFTVSVPLAPTDVQDQRPHCAEERPAMDSTYRILVVDDNRDAADLLSLLLSSEGHETRTAYSGSDALTAADEFRPRVVFCDIGMPGLNGHQFASCIKENSIHASTLLVAITGWGTEDDRRQSQQAG